MNLHIISNSGIVDDLVDTLTRLDLLKNNLVIVRDKRSSFVEKSVPFAPLYSSKFKSIVGDVGNYEKVFIHQFSPLMYRWVASNKFKELNWIIWGADLYGILNVKEELYEELTQTNYVSKNKVSDIFSLYKAKVLLTNSFFKNRAYSKVDHVLTWMNGEYEFAKRNIKSLKATHQYFMYGSRGIANLRPEPGVERQAGQLPVIVVGNSGTPTNNHIDSLKVLIDNKIKANLIVPLAYGDRKYIYFIKDKFSEYNLGTVRFMEEFIPLSEYTNLLRTADALIMNCVRPQGFGNIFTMMLLGKPVFFNKKNYSLQDLDTLNIKYFTLEQLPKWFNGEVPPINSPNSLIDLVSQKKIDGIYRKMFG